ncbi:MAG: aspartate/glutamate racemase family protein [Thermomicrobiales bacterium]
MSIIARVQPDVVTYGFTTASFFEGPTGAEALRDRMAALVPCPIVLPSLAIVQALSLLKARRLSVVTPYPAWNNDVLSSFLEQCSFELLNLAGDEREDRSSFPLWGQDPSEAFSRILEHACTQADVVLLPCTAWRTFEVAAELQQRLGMPVVTANQATSWAISRALGLTDAHPWA